MFSKDIIVQGCKSQNFRTSIYLNGSHFICIPLIANDSATICNNLGAPDDTVIVSKDVFSKRFNTA